MSLPHILLALLVTLIWGVNFAIIKTQTRRNAAGQLRADDGMILGPTLSDIVQKQRDIEDLAVQPFFQDARDDGQFFDQFAAFDLREAWSKRVSTAALNRWFDDALEANPPPAPGGKRIKLRFITQAKTRPPGFVLFGTRLELLPESYQRYLVNGIRRELGFASVPIRLTLRSTKNPFDTKR